VEQLHQLGLKNNRRTKTVRNRNRKYNLHAKWEQLSGNRKVQAIKQEVHKKRKRKLQTTRGADTERALLIEKTFHREAALLGTRQLAMDWRKQATEPRGNSEARCS
jgi:hypothetical protein